MVVVAAAAAAVLAVAAAAVAAAAAVVVALWQTVSVVGDGWDCGGGPAHMCERLVYANAMVIRARRVMAAQCGSAGGAISRGDQRR